MAGCHPKAEGSSNHLRPETEVQGVHRHRLSWPGPGCPAVGRELAQPAASCWGTGCRQGESGVDSASQALVHVGASPSRGSLPPPPHDVNVTACLGVRTPQRFAAVADQRRPRRWPSRGPRRRQAVSGPSAGQSRRCWWPGRARISGQRFSLSTITLRDSSVGANNRDVPGAWLLSRADPSRSCRRAG